MSQFLLQPKQKGGLWPRFTPQPRPKALRIFKLIKKKFNPWLRFRPKPRQKSDFMASVHTRIEAKKWLYGFGSHLSPKVIPFWSRPNMPQF